MAAATVKFPNLFHPFISNTFQPEALGSNLYGNLSRAAFLDLVKGVIIQAGLKCDDAAWVPSNVYQQIAFHPQLASVRDDAQLLFSRPPYEGIGSLQAAYTTDFAEMETKGVAPKALLTSVRRLATSLNVLAAIGGSDNTETNATAAKLDRVVRSLLLGVGQPCRTYYQLNEAHIANDNQALADGLDIEATKLALGTTDIDPTYKKFTDALVAAQMETVEKIDDTNKQMEMEVTKFSDVWSGSFDAFIGKFKDVYNPNSLESLAKGRAHIEQCYTQLQGLDDVTPMERFYFLLYVSRYTNTKADGALQEQPVFIEINKARKSIAAFLNNDWEPQLERSHLEPLLAANLYQNRELVQKSLAWVFAADAANGMLCQRDPRSQEKGQPNSADQPSIYNIVYGSNSVLEQVYRKIDPAYDRPIIPPVNAHRGSDPVHDQPTTSVPADALRASNPDQTTMPPAPAPSRAKEQMRDLPYETKCAIYGDLYRMLVAQNCVINDGTHFAWGEEVFEEVAGYETLIQNITSEQLEHHRQLAVNGILGSSQSLSQ